MQKTLFQIRWFQSEKMEPRLRLIRQEIQSKEEHFGKKKWTGKILQSNMLHIPEIFMQKLTSHSPTLLKKELLH